MTMQAKSSHASASESPEHHRSALKQSASHRQFASEAQHQQHQQQRQQQLQEDQPHQQHQQHQDQPKHQQRHASTSDVLHECPRCSSGQTAAMKLGFDIPKPTHLPVISAPVASVQELLEDLNGRLSMAVQRIQDNGDSRFVLTPEDLYALAFARRIARDQVARASVGTPDSLRASLSVKLLTDLMRKLPQDADGVVRRQRTRGGSAEDITSLMHALKAAVDKLGPQAAPLQVAAAPDVTQMVCRQGETLEEAVRRIQQLEATCLMLQKQIQQTQQQQMQMLVATADKPSSKSSPKHEPGASAMSSAAATPTRLIARKICMTDYFEAADPAIGVLDPQAGNSSSSNGSSNGAEQPASMIPLMRPPLTLPRRSAAETQSNLAGAAHALEEISAASPAVVRNDTAITPPTIKTEPIRQATCTSVVPSKHSHSGTGNALYGVLRALPACRDTMLQLIAEFPEPSYRAAVGTISAVLRRTRDSSSEGSFTDDVDTLVTLILLHHNGSRFATPDQLLATLHKLAPVLGLSAVHQTQQAFLVKQARRLPRGAVHKAWNQADGTIDVVRLINGARAMVREIDSAGVRKDRRQTLSPMAGVKRQRPPPVEAAQDTATPSLTASPSSSLPSSSLSSSTSTSLSPTPTPTLSLHLPVRHASAVNTPMPGRPVVPATMQPGLYLTPSLRTVIVHAALFLADSFASEVLPLVSDPYAQTAEATSQVRAHMLHRIVAGESDWPARLASEPSVRSVVTAHLVQLQDRVVCLAAAFVHQAAGVDTVERRWRASDAEPPSKRSRTALIDLVREDIDDVNAMRMLIGMSTRIADAGCEAGGVALLPQGKRLMLRPVAGAAQPARYAYALIEVNDTPSRACIPSTVEYWHPDKSVAIPVHRPDNGCVFVALLPINDAVQAQGADWNDVLLLRHDASMRWHASHPIAGA